MDLKKLEKLGCLEIKDKDRSYFINSLESVVTMLKLLEQIPLKELEVSLSQETQFRNSKTRDETLSGLHIVDGVFLAPKVIKKD